MDVTWGQERAADSGPEPFGHQDGDKEAENDRPDQLLARRADGYERLFSGRRTTGGDAASQVGPTFGERGAMAVVITSGTDRSGPVFRRPFRSGERRVRWRGRGLALIGPFSHLTEVDR